MALHTDDWLHLAQGLPIGRSARYPHRGDRTARKNLVVHNHADRWTAYCQSCKEGGVKYKEHVRYQRPAPKESTSLTIPVDLVRIGALTGFDQNRVHLHLVRKGMDATMFAPDALSYSASRERLLVQTPQGWLGRDLTDASHQKWLSYNGQAYAAQQERACHTLVLVEDLYSAWKVQWACREYDAIGVAALGTELRPPLILKIMQAYKPSQVAVMFDGDGPGRRGAVHTVRRLKALDIPARDIQTPWGKDPKDLQAQEIRQAIWTPAT